MVPVKPRLRILDQQVRKYGGLGQDRRHELGEGTAARQCWRSASLTSLVFQGRGGLSNDRGCFYSWEPRQTGGGGRLFSLGCCPMPATLGKKNKKVTIWGNI